MASSYSLMTAVGRNKEAAALANGAALKITEIAIGDGDRIPSGGETELLNEVHRKPVAASGPVTGYPNAAFFDMHLEAQEGPFVIREAGLFDQAGAMIAIVRYNPPINKPIALDSGQSAEATLRILVVFSDLENLVLQISSTNTYVSAERRIDTDDGIDGGGDGSQDRTHKLAFGKLPIIAANQVHMTNDRFALFDPSAGRHKGLSPEALAAALGTAPFANVPETVAGELDNKKTHPKGVKAAIDNSRATSPDYFYGLM